jgi:hypothetical protein
VASFASQFSRFLSGRRRRAGAALVCALVVNVSLLAAWAAAYRPRPIATSPPAVILAAVAIVRATPAPTPRPTPTPTPPPPPEHRAVPKPVVAVAVQAASPAPRAAQPKAASLGQGSAARRFRNFVVNARPRPVAGTSAGSGAVGTGASAGTAASTGIGGLAGSGGTGTGGTGNGTGGEPELCGFVELHPTKEAKALRDGTILETMAAIVHYADGHSETAAFPYDFRYRTDAADPFSQRNIERDIPALVQPPPPGTNLADANPAIVYILKHTDANGATDLHDCPGTKP